MQVCHTQISNQYKKLGTDHNLVLLIWQNMIIYITLPYHSHFYLVLVTFMENSPPLFIETVSKNNNIITFLMFLFKEKVNAFVLARRCEY